MTGAYGAHSTALRGWLQVDAGPSWARGGAVPGLELGSQVWWGLLQRQSTGCGDSSAGNGMAQLHAQIRVSVVIFCEVDAIGVGGADCRRSRREPSTTTRVVCFRFPFC